MLGRDIGLVGTFLPKPSYLLSSTYDCSGAIVNGKKQAICYCHYNGVQWQLYECAFYDVFAPLKKEVLYTHSLSGILLLSWSGKVYIPAKTMIRSGFLLLYQHQANHIKDEDCEGE